MLKDLFRLATVAGRAVTRLFVLFVLALTSGVATVGVLVASAAGGEARPHPFRGGPQGVFVAVCGFSHSNHDDAIVFPSEHGRSHAHDYFGATTTDAMSTLESLRASATTCNFLGDTAAYWTPALLADGRPVEPLGANVVYAKATREVIQPFPPGLKVIAGNSQARSPQGFDVAFWSCTARGPLPRPPSLLARSDRSSCYTCTSPTAGTGRTWTAWITRATWRTRSNAGARSHTPSPCRSCE